MKKNRGFKLIALVLTLSLAFIVSAAMAGDTYQTGVVLEETVLNDTFVQSATMTDDKGNQITDLAAADPNNTITLQLVVSEPADAGNAAQQLPVDTNEIPVIYELDERLTAVNGGNSVVNWTYDAEDKVLEFSWVNGKPDGFTADIQVIPYIPAGNDLSGSYVLVTKTNVMVGSETYDDGTRHKLKSHKVTIENGMVRPDANMTEDPVWVLNHVSGNYYTVYSKNTGKYLKLEIPNHAVLEDTDEASAQKILIESRNGGYTFRFSGKGFSNSGNNATGGFACSDQATADNEIFILYPVSSVIDNATKDLSGTWAITNTTKKRMLSSETYSDGKLKADAYTNQNGTFIPFVDQITYWTFEHVVRDWYTVRSDSGYLNISSSGVSVSGTPQKLLAVSDDGFNTISLRSSDDYGVRNPDDYCFNVSKNGIRDSQVRITLKSASGISHEDVDISGSWAITTSSAQAALMAKAADGSKLSSVQYKVDDNGAVYSVDVNISKWTFTKKNGNTYTIQAEDGRYLCITNGKATLSNSESLVYIQKKDGKYRITDGYCYALSNIGTTSGYNGTYKVTESREWHTLAEVSKMNSAIAFDANGGTVSSVPDKMMGEAGEKVALPAMEGTKDGQDFIGWAEVNNIFSKNPGKNLMYHVVYKPGDEYEFTAGTKTLYAVYNRTVRKARFGIRKDGIIVDEPNDNDVKDYIGHFEVEGILKECHWVIDIDATKPVNDYYLENNVTANLNWVPSAQQIADALMKEGKVVFDPETQYVHYYVIKCVGTDYWKIDGVIRNKEEVAVTYNTNITGAAKTDIKNMPASKQVISGTEILIGADEDGNVLRPVRKGYVFKGWNTAPDGSGTYYSAGRYMRLRGNLNLYAQWEEGILSIDITPDWPEGKPAPSGTMITLTAELTGFDDLVRGEDYKLQWRYSTDLVNWIDEPGAHDMTLTYELNTTTAQYTWKVVAVDP